MSRKLAEKTTAQAPDVPLASDRVLLDNETTVITEWIFQPGEQTGWHRHECDYVTVQQSEGCLQIDAADGSQRIVPYENGRAFYRQAPVEHNAMNISDVEVRVIEIEYKKKEPVI